MAKRRSVLTCCGCLTALTPFRHCEGGVAVGSSSDLVIDPWGGMLLGMVAGVMSVVGYIYLTPYLERKFGLRDTCGVHNLHGLPGILGAIGGAISAGMATATDYGEPIGDIFPARGGEHPRSARAQAGFQLAALFTTLGLALGGGAITGGLISLLPGPTRMFEDDEYWEIEGEEEEDEHEEKQAEAASTLHVDQGIRNSVIV